MGNYSQGHICQCLTLLATQRRRVPATISGDRRKTGKQFVQGVLGLAHALLRLGLRSGDVVSICAFNSDCYLEWLLAVAFVGGIAAPLNYRWSYEEARFAMLVVRPVMLVMDGSCNNWLSEFQSNDIPSLRWLASLGPPLQVLLPNGTEHSGSVSSLLTDYFWAPDGAVMICFTSGTTGRPKGVTISHSALIIQSLAKIAIVGYGETDVYFHTVPLCHISGLSSAMAMLMVGACHVLIPKFDAKLALETIEQYKVTSLITVPAMMADLISLTRTKETWEGSGSMKKILNGGGGLSVELVKDFTRFFPRTKLISAYGMTETCSSLTFMTIYDPSEETRVLPHQILDKGQSNSARQSGGVCVGKPAPHVELRIHGDGSSGTGSIFTRGMHIMLGYWDQVPKNASKSGKGTWLDTGDIGSIDEHGNVWLIGRTNGQIKSGGENVYPEEVESILLQHPGVSGTVVVGIPDARLTDMAVACVRIRESWEWSDRSSGQHSTENKELILSSKILQLFCKQNNVTRFKIPRMFIFWTKPFPLTSTGKIRRDQVRKQVMLHLDSNTLPSSYECLSKHLRKWRSRSVRLGDP